MSQATKAIVAAVAGGVVAALGVLIGAMTVEDTLSDVAAVTWLSALSAFIVGAGLTGGATYFAPRNKYRS